MGVTVHELETSATTPISPSLELVANASDAFAGSVYGYQGSAQIVGFLEATRALQEHRMENQPGEHVTPRPLTLIDRHDNRYDNVVLDDLYPEPVTGLRSTGNIAVKHTATFSLLEGGDIRKFKRRIDDIRCVQPVHAPLERLVSVSQTP